MNDIDVKYLGIPNICFSLTQENDDREIEYSKQRFERGFDDSELWSLRDTIAKFIIPRLEAFEKTSNGLAIHNLFKRDKFLVKSINSFLEAMKLVSRDNGSGIYTEKELKILSKGLNSFPKIFMSLWY